MVRPSRLFFLHMWCLRLRADEQCASILLLGQAAAAGMHGISIQEMYGPAALTKQMAARCSDTLRLAL
jgi:hypothetical protein